MPKLVKQRYRSIKGEVKVNCYTIAIPKAVIKQAKINDEAVLRIYAKDGKVIIEEA